MTEPAGDNEPLIEYLVEESHQLFKATGLESQPFPCPDCGAFIMDLNQGLDAAQTVDAMQAHLKRCPVFVTRLLQRTFLGPVSWS